MNALSRTVRRTLVMVVVLAVLLLGFSVFKAVSDGRTLGALIALVVFAGLAAGLIPGSYVQRLASSLAGQVSQGQRPKVVTLAIVGPFLLTVLLGIGVLNAVDSLTFIQEYGGGTFSDALPQFDLVRFAVLGSVSAAWFVWNSLTLIRGKSEVDPGSSATYPRLKQWRSSQNRRRRSLSTLRVKQHGRKPLLMSRSDVHRTGTTKRVACRDAVGNACQAIGAVSGF